MCSSLIHAFLSFHRLPGAVIPGTIVGQQVETGFESRSPTKNLDCRKADLRGEEQREAPPEASIPAI